MTANGLIDEGEGLAVQLCVKNTDPTPSLPFAGLLLGHGGIDPTLPNGVQQNASYGSLAPGETACRPYVLKVTASCGTPARAFLEVNRSDGSSQVIDFELPFPLSPLGETFDSASGPGPAPDWIFELPWSVVSGVSDTTPNAAFLPGSNNLDHSLTSPAISLGPGLWTVQFRHAYDIENFWDGAVLEVSYGVGAFQDVLASGGKFITGGYTNPNVQGGSLMGRPAWSGNSGGFITTRVALPPAASQSIRLRWRYGTDGSIPRVGWWVDSVAITAQNCQAVSPSMPWGLRAAVHGNQVRFDWRPVLSQESASYLLEASLDGGNAYQVLLPVGDTTSFTAQGPDVVAHVRVRAVFAGGVGPPGLPVIFALGSTAPPSTPRQLLATVNGTSVHLAWVLDEPGGSSTGVLLEAGTAPGLANLGRIALPPGTTTFTASGVPPGVYYVRVKQQGPAASSGPSRDVQLSLPGTCQPPAPPFFSNWFGPAIVGNVLNLGWDLGGVGTPAPTAWLLVARAGTPQGALLGSVVVNQRRISATLPSGSYSVQVFAVNPCGTSSTPQSYSIAIP